MWLDFLYTNRVNIEIARKEKPQDAFPESTLPNTPECSHFFLQEPWKDFPNRPDHRSSFRADMILPLPKPIREALIYFDDDETEQAREKESQENKDCLVRLYLGENEGQNQEETFYDSLRNFPLRLNIVLDLELDAFSLSREMAITLSVVHWQAQVDGLNIEFVLGNAMATESDRRKPYTTAPSTATVAAWRSKSLDFTKRAIHLWVIDFDKV